MKIQFYFQTSHLEKRTRIPLKYILYSPYVRRCASAPRLSSQSSVPMVLCHRRQMSPRGAVAESPARRVIYTYFPEPFSEKNRAFDKFLNNIIADVNYAIQLAASHIQLLQRAFLHLSSLYQSARYHTTQPAMSLALSKLSSTFLPMESQYKAQLQE